MWRVTPGKCLILYNLTPKHLETILATCSARLNSSVSGGKSSITPPPIQHQLKASPSTGQSGNGHQEEPPRGPFNDPKVLYGTIAGSLFAATILVCYEDRSRFWIIDKVPATRSFFSTLGLCTERPKALCDPDTIRKYLGEKKIEPSKISVVSTSVIDVADKSVSAISVEKALAKDHNKNTVKTKQGLDKLCSPCNSNHDQPSTKPAHCSSAQNPHDIKLRQLQEKQIGDHDGASIMQAAQDSAKLLLKRKPTTPAEIEARNKLEEERHRKKMEEQKAKDAEFFKKQQEKAEKKAAIEMEKERKLEAEQKQAAQSLLSKIQKNQEFENRASKEISVLCELADKAIKANVLAISICKEHANKLKQAMDANLEEEALKIWPHVHELNELRLQRLEETHKVQQEVENKMVEYIKFLDDTKADSDTKDNENLPSYKKQIQQLAFDVKSMYDKLKNQETVSNVMKHYYCMLKKDKADFKKELEAIVPELKLGDRGLNLSEEELNALLAHAHRRIFQLKHQLREQQMLEHQRLEDALCEQKKADMREANVKLGEELDKQYNELQLDKEAEMMAQNRKFDSELKNKLSKQASQHQDHLQDMLSLQQKQLMEQFDLALRERLIHERHVFIDQIAKHTAKVKGLESALEERADLEKVIAEVQDLISSSMCLMHAVAHDLDCEGEDYQVVRIDDALKRCAQAGLNNVFVQAVLHGVPSLAAERGIYTVSSLEKRFDQVYKQCSRVAFYPETESLFWRFMSRIRYLFHASTNKVKYPEACDFENPEDMAPIDLLSQAKYFMDKKCLAEAVRCLVQLSGSPRSLAQDWIEEARLVLEVRQAAEVLLAYAQSKGMGTIF